MQGGSKAWWLMGRSCSWTRRNVYHLPNDSSNIRMWPRYCGSLILAVFSFLEIPSTVVRSIPTVDWLMFTTFCSLSLSLNSWITLLGYNATNQYMEVWWHIRQHAESPQTSWRISWWAFFVISSMCWAQDRWSDMCMHKKLKLLTVHRCPADEARCLEHWLSLPEVNNQLSGPTNVEIKIVALAPLNQNTKLTELWLVIYCYLPNVGGIVTFRALEQYLCTHRE